MTRTPAAKNGQLSGGLGKTEHHPAEGAPFARFAAFAGAVDSEDHPRSPTPPGFLAPHHDYRPSEAPENLMKAPQTPENLTPWTPRHPAGPERPSHPSPDSPRPPDSQSCRAGARRDETGARFGGSTLRRRNLQPRHGSLRRRRLLVWNGQGEQRGASVAQRLGQRQARRHLRPPGWGGLCVSGQFHISCPFLAAGVRVKRILVGAKRPYGRLEAHGRG